MTSQVRAPVTLEAYLALPETMLPTELIEGHIVRAGAPDLEHQQIVGNIAALLRILRRWRGGVVYIAPTDVVLDDSNVVQPDALWIAPEGSRCIPDAGKRLRGAPDLVVEVLSPGRILHDRRTKLRLYEAHGVREYWLIDPRDRLVEVWVAGDGRLAMLDLFQDNQTFESPLMGSVSVAEFFTAA
ncbi:MAG: Uma2 family endonuclease [Chloroflexi bacterium]|nr:Uma2 family endonuclease [Chloroflexota bacterium]